MENLRKNGKKIPKTVSTVSRSERLKRKYITGKWVGNLASNIFAYVFIIGISYVIMFPLIIRISNAFKSVNDFFDSAVVFIPKNPTMQVITNALKALDIGNIGLKSIALAAGIGLIQVAVCTLAGYGFARFNFFGSNVLFACVIFVLIVPPQTIFIPLFLRFRFFDFFGIIKAITGESPNFINTLWPQLILAATGLGWKNGLYIYMMRQYFKGIPRVLEEAAYIDGAKTFKTFVKIMLPAAVPMMMTVFLFSFSWQWTDVFYTQMFARNFKTISTVVGTISSSNEIMRSNTIQTAVLLLLIPLILLFIVTQKFFIEGVERSGIVG